MSQLTAAAGVLLILLAVWALTNWRWALLGAGVVLVLSAYAQYTWERSQPKRPGAGDSE